MADDVGNPSGGGSTSGDYENAALNVLNSDDDATPEVNESDDDSSEATPPDYEDLPVEDDTPTEDIPEEPEVPEEPVPDIKDEDLSLSGKKAYDKIKANFPQVLKDVPELRQLFFQNKAYTDIFTNIEDARVAASNSEFLDGLGAALNNGSIGTVFESLSENALNNLAEKFIPTLHETNPKLFVRATAPFLANILNDVYEQGTRLGDKNLSNAALWVSKFLTGKPELPKRALPSKEDPNLIAEKTQFENEKRSFYQGQVNGFMTSVDTAIEQGLTKTLENNLDPSGSMSKFVKSAIIKATIDELRDYTNKDRAFVNQLGELFRRAQKARFDQDSKSRAVSAYLGRVKDIALKIRARKVAEALGTQRRERKELTQRQLPVPGNNNQGRRIAPIRESAPKNAPRTELDVIRSR